MDAENFGEMFKQATGKTFNLLASGYAYPRTMILHFAKADDEYVRQMFSDLFYEGSDLSERVEAFQNAAEVLRVKHDDGTWRSHYQNTNAISTYLWLRYPDKYYIYKYEIFREVALVLEADDVPRRDGLAESMLAGYRMYDELCAALCGDSELASLLDAALEESCYPDPKFWLLFKPLLSGRAKKSPGRRMVSHGLFPRAYGFGLDGTFTGCIGIYAQCSSDYEEDKGLRRAGDLQTAFSPVR